MVDRQYVLVFKGKVRDLFNPALLDSWAIMVEVCGNITLGELKAKER
jgi:hypothetical protein